MSFGIQKLTRKHFHTMKTKIQLSTLVIGFILNSCYSPTFLPTVENIDVSEFGSYIELNRNDADMLKGELISIDTTQLIILSNIDSVKQIVTCPINHASSFTLKYAQPKDYSWHILGYTLSTLLHGYFFILTAPINLIVTISVNASGSSDFEYSENDMTFDKLKMFARFPQGIPSKIALVDLK